MNFNLVNYLYLFKLLLLYYLECAIKNAISEFLKKKELSVSANELFIYIYIHIQYLSHIYSAIFKYIYFFIK